MTKSWKAVELRIAKDFGVQRTPLSGSNSRHTSSDTLHKTLYIEIKHGDSSLISTIYKKTDKNTMLVIDDDRLDDSVLIGVYNKTLRDSQATKIVHFGRKNLGLIRLWLDVAEKANKENKIPVMCIHKKGRWGYLVFMEPKNINLVKSCFVHES